MDKKKILIVGFGAMGCRHAQSFLADRENYAVHILELCDKTIEQNIERINANKFDFTWHKNIDDVPLLDIAIVATSSKPRFEIVKKLIIKGYKKFLLEKIVFQSEEQFNIIIKMINEFNIDAYCNFVNRYFKAYNDIKKILNKSTDRVSINVLGKASELSLGCNAIHYIDILQYLTNNDKIKLEEFNLNLLDIDNRRGSMYKEFYGIMKLKNEGGNTISLTSDLELQENITITISQGNKTFILNEGTGKFILNDQNGSDINDFIIIPSSKLTKTIVKDIFENRCRLTTVERTLKSHSSIFKAFNKTLNNHSSSRLCPIT